MANEYIKKEDAVSACQEGWNNSVQDCINNIKVLKPADVVSKADITALLEETEKELTKNVDRKSTPYFFISSVIGILKCKINMMGEKTDG